MTTRASSRTYHLVIYNYQGLAAVMSPDEKDYAETVEKLESEKTLLLAQTGLTEEKYIAALGALQDIQFRPVSEVSEQIKGLERRLGGKK